MLNYNRAVVPIAFGLQNIGATCWFNSFIQAMLSCSSVIEMLTIDKEKNTRNDMRDCLLSILTRASNQSNSYSTYDDMLNNIVINPEQLHALFISELKRRFSKLHFGYNQEDAQEGIILFLDMLNINTVSKLFHHRYRVSHTCHNCGNASAELKDVNYYFLIHSSDLTHNELKESYTIDEFIYRNKTHISDYKCPACYTSSDRLSDCTRNNQLGYIPPIVVIVFEKYMHKCIIDFPLKFEIKSNSSSPLRYKAVAQIEHAGTISGGHYWAVAKRYNGCWQLNDSQHSVAKLTPTYMTYMVFYHRY